MAVATIGAASLAPVFQELCDQVTQAMQKNTKLKAILGFLHSTLNSFKNRVIQPLQEGRRIMYNQDYQIESAVVELQKGAKLVAKVSRLRSCSYFWLDSYAKKLLDLDRHLRSLMEATWGEEVRVVRQQSREVRELMDGMVGRMFDAYKKVMEAETVPVRTETAAEEERGNDEEEEAALVVFQRLFEAVREAREKREAPWMIVALVLDIEMTLYSVQPFLEEMAAHNRVLGRPKEEVRSLRVEMEKGLEVVRRSGQVGKKWEGFSKKKYECIVGLSGLNQCLQREVCILRWQMAKNATESLDWVRKMERTVSEIVSNVGVLEQAGVSGTA
ncbi:hypothetical protein ACLB2K_010317 [Fragaria x ananassa]